MTIYAKYVDSIEHISLLAVYKTFNLSLVKIILKLQKKFAALLVERGFKRLAICSKLIFLKFML
jgi:hypothetical protein